MCCAICPRRAPVTGNRSSCHSLLSFHQMPKRTAPTGNELKEERRTKRRRGRFSELEDDVCETAVLESAESLRVSSPTPTKDYFPWRRLPQELKVKILQYLRRIDLYKCRLLNRDTCNLIRRNIKLMKKRIIGSLEIEPWSLWSPTVFTVRSYDLLNVRRFDEQPTTLRGTFYDKEGRMFIKIPRYLPKALKNSVVRRLEIEQYPLEDELLACLSSCIVRTKCQVHALKIINTSMETVTPIVLFHFLRNVAPRRLVIRHVRECFLGTLTADILQIIASRQYFCVASFMDLNGHPVTAPIDDSIFTHLTALEFKIGAPNMITLGGLKTFIRGMSKRKQMTRGIICTNFSLRDLSFPDCPNIGFRIKKNMRGIKFWLKPDEPKGSI